MSGIFVVYYTFMKNTCLLAKFATIFAAVLIAGTSMVALGDPAFAFQATGPNSVELTAVSLTGGVSFSVPSQDEGKVVESIAANAFSLCVNTEEISIPASVLTIAPTAFDGCVSLTDILVEEGSISYSDRDGVLCDGTGEILILCPAGRSGTFTIPSGVKAVADGAFANCSLLTKIIVPSSSLLAIQANAFADCTQLSSLVIPQNFPIDVTTLGLPAGCTVSRYQPGALDDPTLPPRWAISFWPNGGVGTMADQVFTSGVAAKLRANAFTRTGYTFDGWSWSRTGAVAYLNGQSVTDLAAAGERVILYAKWTGVPYTIVFHEADKGGKTVSQALRYGTKTNLRKNPFTKSGHVFMGWSFTPGGTITHKDQQAVAGVTSKAGATVHFYARWAVRNYSVRFHPNGGKGKMADQGFVFGTPSPLRANAFTLAGNVFVGWALKPDGPILYTNKQAISTLTSKGHRITLYARWRRIRYTVVFDANGGSGTMANQTFAYNDKAKLRTMSFATPPGAPRVFAGWSIDKTGKILYGNGATVCNLSLKDGAVVRLYARWAVRDYKVRFNANGGTGTMADQAFVYGAAAKALSANKFVRGYDLFLGWSRSATAKKPEFKDGQAVRNLVGNGSVVTLYAIWQKLGDPNVVLCLGDSITEGYRCIGLPYPSRLASLSGKSVKNYGKGGKLSSYGAAIAEEALQREGPGTVCILYGANDAIHNVSASTTRENLRRIIRLCRKYNAKPIIATPTPQIGSHARFNSNVRAIASQVRSLAREENVRLVDLNSAFGDGKKYLNPADGLHLSDAGGSLMAREFYKAF